MSIHGEENAEQEPEQEQEQRIAVGALEAVAAVVGEVESKRDREVASAEGEAPTVAATKRAEQTQRIEVASAEASAVEGENAAKAQIAEANAPLAEIRADSRRRAEVVVAQAQETILIAEGAKELARFAKEELAPQEIEKKWVELATDAEAEKTRREAKGAADAILFKYQPEAEGVRKVLEAKADGDRQLVDAGAANSDLAPTLVMIEPLPTLVAEEVKGIEILKIDKITVWDSGPGGSGGNGATADFLAGLIGSLPAMHDLAAQAGIQLPEILGRVRTSDHDGNGIFDGRLASAPAAPVEVKENVRDDNAAG